MTFDEAIARAKAGELSAGGIGTLGEKLVHATLKCWLDEDTSHHEIPLPSGHVADIFDGERVTEVQTAGFSAFRAKLEALLAHYPVTVVHPLVREKRIGWVDPATGEVTPLRRSSRRGSFADAGRELVFLLPLLSHPNLTVRLVLLDVEEHRLLDGWGNGGKRGAHRLQRFPLALGEIAELACPADYAALLPTGLTLPCTSTEFGKAARLKGRALSGALKVLLKTGVLMREKQGRGYVYFKKV